MPRDSSGNYTLPSGINPVVSNTLIDVDWANPTLNDIATQLNNVLTRDGLLSPTGPFLSVNGSVTQPGLAFNSETGTGLYRESAGVMSVAVQSAKRGAWSATGLTVVGSVNATATADMALTARTTTGFSAKLQLAGNGAALGTESLDVIQDSSRNAYLINRSAAFMLFGTSGLERMRIAADGRVDITGSLWVNGVQIT